MSEINSYKGKKATFVFSPEDKMLHGAYRGEDGTVREVTGSTLAGAVEAFHADVDAAEH